MNKIKKVTKKIGTFFGTIFLFVFSLFGWAFSGKRKEKPKENEKKEEPSIDYAYEKEKCLRNVDLDSLPDDFSALSPFDFYDMKTKKFLEPEKEPEDLFKYLEDLKKIDKDMPYDMEMLPLHDKLKEKINEIEEFLSFTDNENFIDEPKEEELKPENVSKEKIKPVSLPKKIKPLPKKEIVQLDKTPLEKFNKPLENDIEMPVTPKFVLKTEGVPSKTIIALPALVTLINSVKKEAEINPVKLPEVDYRALEVPIEEINVVESEEKIPEVILKEDIKGTVEETPIDEIEIEESEEKKAEEKEEKKKPKEKSKEKTLEEIKEEDAVFLTELLDQDIKEKEAQVLLEKNKKKAVLNLISSSYQDFDFPITLFNYNIVINLFSMMKLNNSLVGAHRSLDNYKSYERVSPLTFLSKMRTIDVLEKKTLENLLSVHELRKEILKNYSHELASGDPDLIKICNRLDYLETDLSFRYEKIESKGKKRKKRKILVKDEI